MPPAPATGLTLISSNRLEALADVLIARLREPVIDPDDVLIPRTVIVPHLGMGQWLEQRVARQVGIAANLRFRLPAQFQWDVIEAASPEARDGSPLERAALPWRVMSVLERDVSSLADAAPLRDFLARATPARRWQLARRLGALYDRYLVFRPDWIAAWDGAGSRGAESARWQAALWRALTEGTTRRHRAKLLADHTAALRNGAIDRDLLPRDATLFGIATLPPAQLAWFEALSQHIAVRLHVPVATRQWWADTSDAKTAAKRQLANAERRGEVDALLAAPLHPLLDELGAVGRDFQALLYAGEGQSDEVDRHVEPDGASLLARVQRSVLDADMALIEGAIANDDASIRLHRCHGALREVEALHDALRRRFDADPDLTPRDVIVLCTDIARYAPLVRGVFGAAPAARQIAFHIADRGARETQPLLAVFLRIFELPGSRFTVSDVLSWWDEPAARARFGIDDHARWRIEAWLAATGAHWGADAAFRAAVGGAAQPIGTLRHALSRLLLGYALGESDALIGDVAPHGDIEGGAAAVVGEFARLLDTLVVLHDRVGTPRTALQWRDFTLAAFSELFDTDDLDAAAALATLRAAFVQLVRETADAGFTGALAVDVLRDWLTRALDDDDSRTPWLSGSVCVCGMVPLRSVPFRVVCVLGLDDDAFPRREVVDGLDLTRNAPRAGDRALRDDDRYLFLEAVLAARAHLHLSWSGFDVRDGTARAPSPAVGALLDVLRERAFAGDADAMRASIEVVHPLAPWDVRAFIDPATRSYASEWLPARAVAAEDPPFLNAPSRADDAPGESTAIDLADLRAWLRHPAQYALDRIGARRYDETLADDADQLDVDGLSHHRVLALLTEQGEASALRSIDATAQALAARELVPVGATGRLAAAALIDEANCALRWLRAAGADPASTTRAPVDVAIDGQRLTGHVAVTARGDCIDIRARWNAASIVRRYVEWLALRASGHDGRLLVAVCDGDRDTGLWTFNPPGDPHAALRLWTDLHARARHKLPAWAPKSSAAAGAVLHKNGEPDRALAEAASAWRGDRFRASPGEGDDPAWRIVARGWLPLADPEFLALADATFRPMLDARKRFE